VRAYSGTAYQTDAFSLVDVPEPVPGPGEVRLQIRAAALGFVDGLMVQGRYQIRPPLPYVPGGEIAGVIDAAGPEVAGSLVGKRVTTWQLGGGLGEYAVVPANEVDPIPDALPFQTAAAMLVDYQTAHYALAHRAQLRAGETILVLGAAGAVASAAVQLALQSGAYVIAAASTDEKRQSALDLGAHASVDYGLENWRDALKSVAPSGTVDVVFDPVGGSTFEPAFRSLGKEGRHLVLGFTAGRIPSLPANLPLLKSASLVGVDIRHFLASQPEAAQRARSSLFELVATGQLRAPRLITYPLEQAAQAVDAAMARKKIGKVVVFP
jgi:NADPH:quinone reductase